MGRSVRPATQTGEVGALRRLGGDVDVAERVVLAVEREGAVGPGAFDDLETFIHERAALATVDLEGVELLHLVAQPDAEAQPTAGEDVDDGGVLCNRERVMQRKQEDVGADGDSGGALGDGSRGGEHGGEVGIVDEVVFGEPDEGEAHALGGFDVVQCLGVEVGGGHFPLRWVAKVVEQANFEGHGGSDRGRSLRHRIKSTGGICQGREAR